MKRYNELLPDAQKYAAEQGAQLILEWFFYIILFFCFVYVCFFLQSGNTALLFLIISMIVTGVLTSCICYFFFCKNWRRMHIWYFKKQIEIQYTCAESFLDPEKTELIVQKSLKDYFEKRQSQILAEAHQEDPKKQDEYIHNELVILDANEPVLYEEFWNQTVQEGERYVRQAEILRKILKKYYGVVQ
jgi:hypothetical protein